MQNKSSYRYGNRFSANTLAFYKMRTLGVGVAPNVGLQYEKAAVNIVNKAIVIQTGGNVTSVSGGLEMNFNKMALGANVQIPVLQNFAEGQTQLKLKGLVHVTVAL